MTVALHEGLNKPISSLISVDMAPSEGRISPESVPSPPADTSYKGVDKARLYLDHRPRLFQ